MKCRASKARPRIGAISYGTRKIRHFVYIIFYFCLAVAANAQTLDPSELDLDNVGSIDNPFGEVDTSAWDSLYDNPNTLNGCTADASCREMIELIEQGTIDDLSIEQLRSDLGDFLNPDDPNSIVGELLQLDTICEPETGQVTAETIEITEYSCHSGYAATDTVSTCQIPLIVTVDENYQYSCNVPDETLCTAERLGGYYYKIHYIDETVKDPDNPADHQILFPNAFDVSDCAVIEYTPGGSGFSVGYKCTGPVEFWPYDWFVMQDQDCRTASCELLEGTPGCVAEGETTCEGGEGTIHNVEACVTDGSAVSGQECLRERVHELEVRFSYECHYVLDEASGELRPDPKCVDIIDSGACTQNASECVQRAPHETQEVICEVGDDLAYTEEACQAQRYAVGDMDYHYTGSRTFDAPSASFQDDNARTLLQAENGCQIDEETCIVNAPDVFEDEICKSGYEDVDTSFVCENVREIVVDIDYFYAARRSWNADTQTHEPTDPYRDLLLANCLSQGETCEVETEPTYEAFICLQGYREVPIAESCEIPRVLTIDTDYGYIGTETYYEDLPGDLPAVPAFVQDQLYQDAIAQGCSAVSSECAVTRPQTFEDFVCHAGWDYTTERVTIRRDRIVEVDTDYLYKAYQDYVDGTGFVKDGALLTLEADNLCVKQSQSCSQQSPGVFSTHECTFGYSETYTYPKCEVPLQVTTVSDYVYQDFENWNGSSFVPTPSLTTLRGSSVCTMQSRICSKVSPGVFSDYSCDVGYSRAYTHNEYRRHASPRYDYDYIYEGKRSWNGSSHTPDALASALASDASCSLQSTTCSVNTPPPYEVYTCRSGYQDFTENMSCVRQRQITVDEDYIYTVDRVWDVANSRWTGTGDWNAVRGTSGTNAQCTRQSSTCTAESPGVYSEHTCQQGYRIDPENMSCSDELSFTVETDYRYTGYEDWNGSSYVKDATLSHVHSQATSKSCVRESLTNQNPESSADLTSRYECISGSITYSNQSTCDTVLTVTITTKTWYRYIIEEWRPAWESYMEDNDCFVEGTTTIWKSGEPFLRYRFSCSAPKSYGGTEMPTFTEYIENDYLDTSACAPQISAGEALQSEVCIEGSSTKTIDGQSVTRGCWKWRRTYGSTYTQTVNSCSVPSGFSFASQSGYTGSPALGTSRNLQKKIYTKTESLAGAPNVIAPYTCLSGYWDNASGTRFSYACSPPSGATLKTNACGWYDGSGTCRLRVRSYTVPNPGPPGGYNRHKEVWKCDLAVTGTGVAAPELVKTRKAWVWDRAECTAARNAYSDGCSQTSAGYVGDSYTKTIDGLSITRQWEYQRNYTCQQRQDFDSCTSLLAENKFDRDETGLAALSAAPIKIASLDKSELPDFGLGTTFSKTENEYAKSGIGSLDPPLLYADIGDWTYDSQVCINYEGGICTLWEKRYKREESDPSGGCHEQTEVWRCEAAVSGAGTAQMAYDITSETWEWPSAECAEKIANYDSCVYLNQAADTSTGGTRIINGMSITRASWELKRNYSCTRRESTHTCAPPAGAEPQGASCVWSDAGGTCRLSDLTYHVPLPDPTGGCTEYTDSYRCETRNHGTEKEQIKEFSHMAYPVSSAQRADMDNPQCTRVLSQWGGGQTPQIIDGISVYPSGSQQWYLDQHYRCYEDTQINTCNVPANAVLENEECLETIDGGACSLKRQNYIVEEEDPSGGCHQYREEYLCSEQIGAAGEPVAIPTEESGSYWDESACTNLEANEFCTKAGQTCTEPGGIRIIGGIEITKSCWKYDYNYECANRTHYDTCSPDPGAVLSTETCAFTDRDGICRLFDRVYINEDHDPSGGCHQYEHIYLCENEKTSLSFFDTQKSVAAEYYDRAPYDAMQNAYYACAFITGSRVNDPNEVRTIDGLSLNRTWSGTWDYDCSNREAVDTCSVPPGSTLLSSSCSQTFNGSCVQEEKTYSVPVEDTAGGCSAKETLFRCDDPLGSYPAVQEWKDVIDDKFDASACTIEAISSASFDDGRLYDQCVQTGEVCSQGAASKTIDGLEVFRDCWGFTRSYSCSFTETFDTCEVPNDAINLRRSCVWSDMGGTCRLYENKYDILQPDPSGGCTAYLETFRCEDPQTGPELINDVRHIESEIFNDSSCDRDSDGSVCQSPEEVCIEGPETRTINGMEIYRECWNFERRNSCSRRDIYDECGPFEYLGDPVAACLWTDSSGTCRLYENTYARPVDDGSGGCHKYETAYWCENPVATLSPDFDRFTVSHTALDMTSCGPVQGRSECLLERTVCGDPGEGPRRPDFAKDLQLNNVTISETTLVDEIDEDCWREDRVYSCEQRTPVNTCVGQITQLCVLNSADCIGTLERNGECAKEEFNYTCGIEGTDYCEIEQASFTCEQQVFASTAQIILDQNGMEIYEPSTIQANVVSTYYDNSVCAEMTADLSCTLIDTVCDDAGKAPRYVQRAQDDYHQQFTEYAPKQKHECWREKRIYSCGAPDEVPVCTDQDMRCTLEHTACLSEDRRGNCLIEQLTYSCEEGTGTCSSSSQTYICNDPVDGLETTGNPDPDITSEYDTSVCDAVEESAECLDPVIECVDHGDYTDENGLFIREVDGYPISAECWGYERTYQCTELGEYQSDCEVPDNCESQGDSCIGHAPSGECLTTEHNYTCQNIITEVVTQGTPGTCETGDTPKPASTPNQNIDALSALMGLAQADREYTAPSDVSIFEGTDKQCGRDVLGLKNCCKDAGVLLSLGIGTCSDQEIELAVQKEENRCVYVGSYCSKKAFFGACLKKKQTYCCYEAEIGKIIAEAGRRQLGIEYGTPKEPNCAGFTVEQFQQLDLSDVDFSSVTASIMQDLNIGDPSALQDQFRDRIGAMTHSGGG